MILLAAIWYLVVGSPGYEMFDRTRIGPFTNEEQCLTASMIFPGECKKVVALTPCATSKPYEYRACPIFEDETPLTANPKE